MPDFVLTLLLTLIGAVGGIGAFAVSWHSRREQRRLIAAQAEKVEAETDEIEISAASKLFVNQQDQIAWQGKELESLKRRIAELESDKRDRLAEMATLYETLMSAMARNRYLEADRARIMKFLRMRHPDVYAAYRSEYDDEVDDGE